MITSMNSIEHLASLFSAMTQWLGGVVAVVFMAKFMGASVAIVNYWGVLYGPMGENTLEKTSKNALFYRVARLAQW